MMRTPADFISEDYIELAFEKKVYPIKVRVYETYNPGAIIRILCCDRSKSEIEEGFPERWYELYKGHPVKCPATSRIFEPELRKAGFPTNLIRLELNQSKCEYYTELDGVQLVGRLAKSDVNCVQEPVEDFGSSVDPEDFHQNDSLADIPCHRKPVKESNIDKVTKEILELHLQDGVSASAHHGISAALDISDNGHFDRLPKNKDTIPVVYVHPNEMSNPDPLTARSSPTMLPPGSAPIKKEFLDLNHIPKLSEHLPEDVKEQLKQESKDGSINTPDGEPVVKRPKLKGRNKKRPIEKNPEIESKFCPQTLAGKQCLFGDRCRFMHDVDEYMAKKPPDLGDTCHIYDTYGYCPYSFTCRFASRHITEDKKNMKNEELFERMKDGKGILNILDKEIQKKLWKKKYDFSLADSVWKRVKQFQDQNVAVTKNKPDNNTNSALKTEKLSCDDKPDMSDENTIQLGDEIPRESTDMLLGDCDQADGYEISYSAVSSKDQPLSDGQACQETEIANSSDVSIQKCESEEGVTGSDSMRQFTDMLRELNRNTTPKKKIDFHDKLYLAPLTTVGNLPFRRICKRFGADITCSEMALCTNLLQGKQSEWALLKRHESEDIFGAQLCGSFPDTMTRCAQVITDSVDVDFIDINCGCPIDLIFKKGEGCALMGRTGRFETIVRSMTSLMDIPLTVKLRTGIYEDKNIAHTLLPHLRDWGVSMVTLHGRSREQRYTRLANWQYIGECAKIASPMPLFGNGDILSYEDYLLHKKESGIAGVMIARGALIKPWIFTEIKEQRHWDISASERFDILRDFTNFGLEHWGSDQQGVTITRRFLLEWLSFLYRYIPVGLLERLPQRINEKPPYYFGRNDLETLMASPSCADWIKISEMLLGPVPDGFVFLPKHKASAYK